MGKVPGSAFREKAPRLQVLLSEDRRMNTLELVGGKPKGK